MMEKELNANNMISMAQEVLADLDLILRKTYLQLFTGIVMMNPVDTGRSRGNWKATVNKSGAMSNYWNENHFDPSGNKTVKGITNKVLDTAHNTADDYYSITNNIYYVQFLENGHSKQAPTGMIKVNMDKFESILSQALHQYAGKAREKFNL